MVPNPESPRSTGRPPGTSVAFALLAAGLLAVVGFITWQGTQHARGAAEAKLAAGESGLITLAVDGMSCVGCAGTVETSLKNVAGVAEVTVDYEQRVARIRLADTTVPAATLVAAVEEAGYKARVER